MAPFLNPHTLADKGSPSMSNKHSISPKSDFKEVWKDIVGYEGYYQISSDGRVKSLRRIVIRINGVPQTWLERILDQTINKKGYPMISLSKAQVQRTFPVHRLVAKAFICNPDNKPEVNHKDWNKRNNRFDNLEWVTHKEQMEHASRNGLLVKSEESKNRMREAKRSITKETRQRMSIAASNRSDEHNYKISLAKMGTTLSEEHKAKISASLKGRRLSEEHKRKIGDANKRARA